MNMNNYNQMMQQQLMPVNPYAAQFPYPQLGGLFGGYNMGMPRQRGAQNPIGQMNPSGIDIESIMQSFPQIAGLFDIGDGMFNKAPGQRPRFQKEGQIERIPYPGPGTPSSGVAPGLFDQTPSVSKPRGDRTFVSGGVGKNGGGNKQVIAGKPNFGAAYEKTGEFGKKGLRTIQKMGYEGQEDFLAANPVIAERYKPSSSPMAAADPGRRSQPRYR